jgi:hypothetical protein
LILERLRDFQSASDRLFEIFEKEQSHAVTSGQTNQFVFRFSSAETIGPADNLIQLLLSFDLVVDHQPGVADDVDQEKVGYLEFEIGR